MSSTDCIVALDTSGSRGSVAVGAVGELRAEAAFKAQQAHASELLPAIARLCAEAGWRGRDVGHLYLSIGPGSFTGLRIAVAVAKALAFSHELRIVAVPSPEVLVQNTAEEPPYPAANEVATVVDAKRRQVYAAIYQWCGREGWEGNERDGFAPGFRRLAGPMLTTPAELLEKGQRPLLVLGEGLRQHGKALASEQVILAPESEWECRARHVLRSGWLRAQAGLYAEAESLTPLYLRRPEAVERWEKLHGHKE